MQPEISLHIFQELESGKSLAEIHDNLKSVYGIEATQSERHPNLYQYVYNQIDSYKERFSPLVLSSRGTILDVESKNVIAYPFRRFFNYGEWSQDPFVFNNIKAIQEKVDGSLMILYWYYDGWNVATKGNPDASGKVGAYDFTFSELFWEVMNKQHPQWKTMLVPRFTYMFELCSKYNQVITDQSDNEGDLTLIGIRCKNGWYELNLTDFYETGWKVVTHYPMKTMDEVLYACKSLNPKKQEGFVLVDESYNRLKVKNPFYVLAHNYFSLGGVTAKKALSLYRSGENEEFLSYFSEFKEKYEQYISAYHSIADKADSYWNHPDFQKLVTSGASRKDLALWINQNVDEKYRFMLFEMLKGKQSKDVVENLLDSKIIQLMEDIVNG
ncbi:MAG: T4 RnlA family RNA ligase [Patescibacteria group bacterium]|nr:T4 RnlA family RNA ligase [Patescibacteria group bacterium]